MKANITYPFFRLSKLIVLAMLLIMSSIVNAQSPTPAARFKGGSTYWVDGTGLDYVLPKDTFMNLTGAHLEDSVFIQTTGLLTAFNNQGVDQTTLGQVTFVLAPGYVGYVEPNLINIGRTTLNGGYPYMTSQRPVVIKPAAGSSFKITTSAIPMAANSSLVRFNGAQYVTIDGEGTPGQRNITFAIPPTIPAQTNAGVKVIDIKTFAGGGCRFLTVKNCRILGFSTAASPGPVAINTYCGIYSGGVTGPATAPLLTSQNITITNNLIEAVQNGIYMRGVENIANRQDNALTVSNNIIGGTTSPYGSVTDSTTYIGGANAAGITLIGQKNAVVSGNTIRNSIATALNFRGIQLENVSSTLAMDSNISITGNKIYNLRATGSTAGVYGIRLRFTGHTQPLAINITNNTVSNILSSLTGSLISGATNIVGMMIEDNSSNVGVNVYNNSIHLYGDTLNTSAVSACFLTTATVTGGVRVVNNIFVNRLGRTLSTSGLASSSYIYAVGSAGNPFSLISNNAYYVNNTAGSFSFIGNIGASNKATLKTWTTATGDNSSVTAIPPFVGTNNDSLVISNGSATTLGNAGIATGLLTDINGNARSSTTPSLGAYEFTGNPATANYALRGGIQYLINGISSWPAGSTGTGSFATLADAVTYLNTYGVTGNGNINLRFTSGYTGETTFIPHLLNYSGASASRKLVIDVTPGTSVTVSAPALANVCSQYALFNMIAAKYVTINGSSVAGQRNLTFAMPGTFTNSGIHVLGLETIDTDSLLDVSVSNCNIVGASSTTAIYTASGIYHGGYNGTAAFASANAGNSKNITVTNNYIRAVRTGIYFRGANVLNGQTRNVTITQNIIGGTTPQGAGLPVTFIGGAANQAGIMLKGVAMALVDSNIIRNSDSVGNISNGFRGIDLDFLNEANAVDSAIVISRNTIYNLTTNGAGGTYCVGIRMSLGAAFARGIDITNNSIAKIRGVGAALAASNQNPTGILIDATGTITNLDVDILHNTVNLNGTTLTSNFSSAGLFIGASVQGGVRVQNNIFMNRLGRAGAVGGNAYAMFSGATTAATSPFAIATGGIINGNAYGADAPNTPNNFLVGAGTNTFTFLKQWQTFISQDLNSAGFNTFFANDTTPVLDPRFAGIIYNGVGTLLAVPKDITGATRPSPLTCAGALQFTQEYLPLAGNQTYDINGSNNFPRTSGTAPFSFATITDAINYLNTNGVDGLSSDTRRVTLRLAAGYIGEPVDTFIPPIRLYPRTNSSRIVVLTTAPGRSDTIRTNTSQLYPANGSVIRFLGGSYFEIDGNNGSGGRGITIALPSVANPNAGTLKLVDITSGDNAVSNVRIRNCNLMGVSTSNSISTFAAIYMGGIAATPSAPLVPNNSNHLFENNLIMAVKYGIYAQGITAPYGQHDRGMTISKNVIGSAATYAGNSLTWGGAANAAGIFLGAQANVLIDSNVISNNMNTFANNRAIELNSAAVTHLSVDSGITISRNTITGISNATAAGGAYGIFMSFNDSITAKNDRGLVIKNNMISNITAPGTAGAPATSYSNVNPIGIYVEELLAGVRGEINTFGLRIWSNSINLGYGTSMTVNGSVSSCVAFSSQVKGGVIMQNNIFQNRLGRASGTGTAATVLIGNTSSIFSTSGNNIYYTNAPGSTNILAASASTAAAPVVQATIEDVMAFTRQDTMSLNFITNFTSETNLLLTAGVGHHAFDWGTPIPSVTNDIQNDLRNPLFRPTIGADNLSFAITVDSIAARVYDVTNQPLFCASGTTIPVTFRVFERASSLASDTLWYSVNNGTEQFIVGGINSNEFTRTYNIPPQLDNSSIAYRLVVRDASARRSALPLSGYNYTSTSFNIFPLTYGFDLPNVGGWTVSNFNVNGTPASGGWDLNAFGSPLNPVVLPKTGLKAAVFPASTLPDGSVSRLISPCLDFTNMKVPTLRMWVSQNAEIPLKNDAVQVIVGFGLLTWSGPLAIVNRVNSNLVFPEYTQMDVCLINFAGNSGYRIAIEALSKNGMNIVLDSIVIFDDVLNQPVTTPKPTICAYQPLVLNIPASSDIYRYTILDTRNGLPLGPSVLGNANGSALSVLAPNPSNPAIARVDSVRASLQYTNTLSGCVWQMPDTTTIKISNFFGGPFFVKGAPYDGVYSTGTFAKPDGSKLGDVLTYSITPPSGMTNADYGVKWTAVGYSVATPIEGRPMAVSSFTPATPTTNAYITASPSSPDLDSTFKVSVTLKFINSDCDSVIARYVKVSSAPLATFTSASDSVCSGAAIYFTNTTTALPNTYPLTYFWDFGDGTVASTGDANKTYAFNKAPGLYTVTLKATNNAGVFSTSTKQIRVLPAPATGYTNGLACGTDPIAFTNTTASAVSYLWTVRLNNVVKDTSSQVNPTFSFAIPDTSYNVNLRATNNLGCFRDSVRGVFAFAKPVAAFTTVNQCAGTNAKFVNTSTITSGGSNRVNTFGSLWDFGDGHMGLADPIYQYTAPGTYTVKLKVTSNYGCVDSTMRSVTIFERPVTGFTTGIACQDNVVSITNNTSYTGGANKVIYSWDFGDFSPLSSDANPVKTYGVLGNFIIQLIAHDTVNNCYDTTSKPIEVNEVPFAVFDANDGCVGTAIEFNNGAIPPTNQTLTYTWAFGDGGTSTASNPSHIYTASGRYPVTMKATTNKGCFDDAVDTVTIDNINVDNAKFTFDTLDCKTVEFTPDFNGLQNYYWEFGDGAFANSPGGKVTNLYQTKGKHLVKLTVTSENGCKATFTIDSVETFCTVGLEELFASKFNLSVYPNPFESVANISYKLDSKQDVTITVMDILGRVVGEVVENNQSAGAHIIKLDDSKFSARSAVYMVRIKIGEDMITKQMIRQ